MATFVSPASRATQTAELAGLTGAKVDPDLWEWDYGGYEGLTTDRHPEAASVLVPVARRRHPRRRRSSGRDRRAGRRPRPTRCSAGSDRCCAGGDVALVAHGHLLRVLTARWLGLEPAAGRLFRPRHRHAQHCSAPSTSEPVISSWNVPPRRRRLAPQSPLRLQTWPIAAGYNMTTRSPRQRSRRHARRCLHRLSRLLPLPADQQAESMPAAALRTSLLPSGWTPIELIKHLRYVERRWLEWGFEGRDVADPWGDEQRRPLVRRRPARRWPSSSTPPAGTGGPDGQHCRGARAGRGRPAGRAVGWRRTCIARAGALPPGAGVRAARGPARRGQRACRRRGRRVASAARLVAARLLGGAVLAHCPRTDRQAQRSSNPAAAMPPMPMSTDSRPCFAQ